VEKSRRYYFALAIMLAAVVAIAGQSVKPRQSNRGDANARDLYYDTGASSSGEARNLGIRVKVYSMTQECNLTQVSPNSRFVAGDRVRFGVESNDKGYLYIVQRGSTGKSTMLYPHQQIDAGKNQLARGTELIVPGGNWYKFDNTPGVEHLTFIFSRKRLDLLPQLVAAADTSPGPAPAAPSGSVEASVLAILQGKENSRDLVLSPEAPAAPEVNTSGVLYEPVYAVSNVTRSDVLVLPLKLNHR
jgi:hypothetical protein